MRVVRDNTSGRTLEELAEEIRVQGPRRVMIEDNYATSPSRALEEHNIESNVIFIRYDGWSLGAPSKLESAARGQYDDGWIGIMRQTKTGWTVSEQV